MGIEVLVFKYLFNSYFELWFVIDLSIFDVIVKIIEVWYLDFEVLL